MKEITKETLVQMYTVEEQSTRTIAVKLHCSATHIKNKLKQYKIQTRNNTRLGRPNTKSGKLISKLENKIFGYLKVICYVPKKGWQCKCKCGEITHVKSHHLIQGKQISCGCKRKCKANLSPHWKGEGQIPATLFCSYKSGAKRRKISWNITIKDAWETFIEQKGICPFTGIKLSIGKSKQANASLDRRNSQLGYTKENIQWVHKKINQMKWDTTEQEFIHWCKKVANYHNYITPTIY